MTISGTKTVPTKIFKNRAHSGGGLLSDGDSNAIGLRSRFTMTETRIYDNEAEAEGGGLVLDGDAKVVLADLYVADNVATDDGGGLAFGGRASLDATRLVFERNETNGGGGGAYIDTERPVVLKDSRFTKNLAGVQEPLALGDIPPLGCPGCPIWETSGNVAGGGALFTEGGPINVIGSIFEENVATDEGGAVSIDNFGQVTLSHSTFRKNLAGSDGGALENSGMRTIFDHLLVDGNKATLSGGGIYNSSSDAFLVIDTTIQNNVALDGGGFANAPDADLFIKKSAIIGNTARMPGLDDAGLRLDGGEGGGFWSKADGDAHIENTTISHNKAGISGGGLFHDADGELRLSNITVWRNSAPMGGGIGVVESDFAPEVPPKANESVILRNSVVGGSLAGGSCDWYVTSEGGNVTGGSVPINPSQLQILAQTDVFIPAITSCFTTPMPGTAEPTQQGLRNRTGDARLDAVASNGGPTMTNASRYGSLAIDNGILPCPETDQRGVVRPQNDKCDSGAYEFVGPRPVVDNEMPDTEYLTGPVQDTLETNAFTFTGSDNMTITEELQFECRLYELDLTEEPEVIPPWEPVPPELMWTDCGSPWSVPLVGEEGNFVFEVRAIDRAGNVDDTPDIHHIGQDLEPPQTIILEGPTQPISEQPGGDVLLLRHRQLHAAPVLRVRVPPRHP